MEEEELVPNLDPLGIYIRKAHANETEAQGLEWLAYRIFGATNIGSITFMIDPLKAFRMTGQQAVPVNRTRKFSGRGSPNSTKVRTKTISIVGESPPNLTTSDPFDRLPYSERATSTSVTSAAVTQQLLQGELLDTTYRTRPFGNEEGEFELWNPQIFAKGATRVSLDDSDNWAEPNNYRSRTADVVISNHIGPCARVSATNVGLLKTTMRTDLLNLMGSNAAKLASEISPRKRMFSLAYSVGELKDLPRSLEAAMRTLIKARRFAMDREKTPEAKLAAAEFLSLEFGWKQMYKDAVRFMDLPERLARKINFLKRRHGKLTTLRLNRTFEPIVVASPPSFTHTLLTGEIQKDLKTEALISRELRVVVRTLIDFPQLEVPEVRRNFIAEHIGAGLPTPEDMYNLMPWTWLFDWFTGLGDFVSCYDRVNLDPKLVDFGCITGESTCVAKSILRTERQTIRQRAVTPPIPPVWHQDINPNSMTREARLHCKLQIRRSLSSAYGVKPSWETGVLSAFQISILGALGLIRAYKTP